MQLRFKTDLTSQEYVSRKAWQEASLPCCPLHPEGNCKFGPHGTYERGTPPGTNIRRWYCPSGHCTFSLLPDCFAARFPGTLMEVEAVVVAAEQVNSLQAVADALRPNIDLPGAIRWTTRRIQAVHELLVLLLGLLPDLLADAQPSLLSFRQCLSVDFVLPTLREVAAVYLPELPSPLGFLAPSATADEPERPKQQPMGHDPP